MPDTITPDQPKALATIDINACNDTKWLLEHAGTVWDRGQAMQAEHEAAGTLDQERIQTILGMYDEARAAKARADQLHQLTVARDTVKEMSLNPIVQQPAGGDGASGMPPGLNTQALSVGTGQPSIRVPFGLPGEYEEWPVSECGQRASAEYQKEFSEWVKAFALPATASSGQYGGKTFQTPLQFAAGIKELCRLRLWIRRLGTVWSVRASQKLGFRMEGKHLKTMQWGCACAAPEQCDEPGFKAKILEPQVMSGCVQLCREDLRGAAAGGFNLEAYLRSAIVRDAAELEEEAFFLGHGNGQPLGIFHENNIEESPYFGLGPANDIDTLLPGQIQVDDLIRAHWHLPECCRNSASLAWMFHPTIISLLMQLKDGVGRHYWNMSLIAGQPNTILGHPVYESSYVPGENAGEGDYWGGLADWSGYYIGDGMDPLLERDDNIQTDHALWVYRGKTDGMPFGTECFVRMRVAETP